MVHMMILAFCTDPGGHCIELCKSKGIFLNALIEQSFNRTLADCSRRCLRNVKCRSFNFEQDIGRCELNDEIYNENKIEVDDDVLFYSPYNCQEWTGVENGSMNEVTEKASWVQQDMNLTTAITPTQEKVNLTPGIHIFIYMFIS